MLEKDLKQVFDRGEKKNGKCTAIKLMAHLVFYHIFLSTDFKGHE